MVRVLYMFGFRFLGVKLWFLSLFEHFDCLIDSRMCVEVMDLCSGKSKKFCVT